MRNRIQTLGAFAVVLTIVLTAGSHVSKAGSSFEFLFEKDRVSNDRQFFLHMAVGDSGFSRAAIEPVLPRVRRIDDDLPVMLFLANNSKASLELIVNMRSRNLSWSTICRRINVPHEVLFVGIDQDPGPPYGEAWGHWRNRRNTVVLSDREFAGLVHVQMAHRFVGGSCYEIARGAGRGEPEVVYVARKKGRHDKWHGHERENEQGHGKGKTSHGHGKRG